MRLAHQQGTQSWALGLHVVGSALQSGTALLHRHATPVHKRLLRLRHGSGQR
jgi:hypothetical protein